MEKVNFAYVLRYVYMYNTISQKYNYSTIDNCNREMKKGLKFDILGSNEFFSLEKAVPTCNVETTQKFYHNFIQPQPENICITLFVL